MTILTALLLIAGGLLCGIINVVGGGGSLLALPILLGVGLPAPVANGTNRVAILCQDLTSLATFGKHKAVPWGESFRLSIPVVIGSLAGAWAASRWLDENLMNGVLLLLIAGTAVMLLTQKKGWTRTGDAAAPSLRPNVLNVLLFFLSGFYGGFIQAGFTYLVMAMMVLRLGSTLLTADAVKIFLNLLILPFVLAIFVWQGQVAWLYGLVMGIGSAAGGYLGTRFVMRWSPELIRKILLGLLGVSALYILFFRVLG